MTKNSKNSKSVRAAQSVFFPKLIAALIYILPAVLFCSYYPRIAFGSNSSMNFELSLPLIWLVIFDAVVLIAWVKKIISTKTTRFSGISDRRFFIFAWFPLFAIISVAWSPNPIRGILTAGIIWLLFFAVFAIVFLLKDLGLPNNFKKNTLIGFFTVSIIACLICWGQCILDIIGLARTDTLMCLGCTYHSFGFPHPSGLAIEPQFMGNLLLAPSLTSLYLLIFHRQSQTKKQTKILTILAAVFIATLFLTFSRGAIYAFAVALCLLIFFALRVRKFRWSLIVIPIVTFIFTLCCQGIFAAISPTSETFTSGVTKSIHQLSLGIIDLRETAFTKTSPSATTSVESTPVTLDSTVEETVVFDGYVPESTNIRLELTAVAAKTWAKNPVTMLFGVGLGGAGTAMHQAYPEIVTSPKEIVQNQLFSLLLEVGIIGVALALFGLALAFVATWPELFPSKTNNYWVSTIWSQPVCPLLIPLIVAYLISLCFFAGLPNALHIYLLPPLLFAIFQKSS